MEESTIFLIIIVIFSVTLPKVANYSDNLNDFTKSFERNAESSNNSFNQVIDCRNLSTTCGNTDIEKRISKCANHWRPFNDYKHFDCSFTSKNTEEITLISDMANYVAAPKANKNYTVEPVGAQSKTGVYPWDMEFLPSGEIIVTNREGTLRIISEQNDNQIEKIDKLEVVSKGENGLLGLAVDPNFKENNFIYLYYTFNISEKETLLDGENIYEQKVSRFKLTDQGLTDENVLLEIPGSKYHSGGRLEFGPDDKLYITTGEAFMEYKSIEKDFLGGKILRINKDGTVPKTNPFKNNPTYSMGHRNPQGIAWNPKTKMLYNTEHGTWRKDEINKVKPGKNYGWAAFKCRKKYNKSASDTLNITEPKEYQESKGPTHCWDEWTMAPSGATFVNDTDHPWHGNLYVAGLRGKYIAEFESKNGTLQEEKVFYSSYEESQMSLRLRDVEYHENSLYVIGDQFGMVKLTPSKLS